ncbi:MAG: hypothetical protein PV358_12525 [Acidimicrobiales bacterium]|nr:hypothetical protein [Acidimicrobiales bacterium]
MTTSGPTGASDTTGVAVTRGGDASDEEVAAIVAAVEVAWPRPAVLAAVAAPPRWRFSGRWWTKPVPLRRNRPW